MQEMFRNIILSPALLLPESVLFGRNKKSVYSFFYHHVSDSNQAWLKPFYRSFSGIQFRKELAYLLKYFIPVSLEKMHKILSGQEHYASGKPLMHISFDDGLRSCRTEIAPILLELGIPASFFINPAFIDNKDLFFRYKIGLLLSERPNIPLSEQKQLMKMTYADIPKINHFLEIYDLDYKQWLLQEKPYIETSDIAWMIAQGFSIGAHSFDHPDFRFLNEQERKKQVSDSLEWIYHQFPQKIKIFSFPFTDAGMPASFIHWLSQQCDLSFGCAGIKTDIIETHLQRLAMDQWPASSVRNRIKRAFYLQRIRTLSGKNNIIR